VNEVVGPELPLLVRLREQVERLAPCMTRGGLPAGLERRSLDGLTHDRTPLSIMAIVPPSADGYKQMEVEGLRA
jgi:hypothetical protein